MNVHVEVKKQRILHEINEKNLEALTELLDSQELYHITNDDGESLLHIAINKNCVPIFDFLLSIDDIALNRRNKMGETPLIEASKSDIIDDDYYFVKKLIEKGAAIDFRDRNKQTALHHAAHLNKDRIVKLLVEKGCDVNAQDCLGSTPLHKACGFDNDELILCLLFYNADPRIEDMDGFKAFDIASIMGFKNEALLETLFMYTYDKYTHLDVTWETLLKYGEMKSPYFDKVKKVDEIKACDLDNIIYNMQSLFSLNAEMLTLLVQRFGSHLRSFLSLSSFDEWAGYEVTLEKVEFLRTNGCEAEVINCIQNVRDNPLIYDWNMVPFEESYIAEILCYLLSYGMNLDDRYFLDIYRLLGHCELFRILLHMDFQKYPNFTNDIMPSLNFDITLDLEKYLENPYNFDDSQMYLLLHYFSHPKVNSLCLEQYEEDAEEYVNNIPKVPLLVELARNVFRKYFIKTFQIKNCRQFLTLLRQLPISNTYIKIITYETKLYNVEGIKICV